MNELEQELKSEFLDAAEQLVLSNESCFLRIEKLGLDPRLVNRMFQLTHNLKRSSGAAGFDQMSAFAHQLERFLLKIKGRSPTRHAVLVGVLLRCNERIYYMLDQLKQNLETKFDNSDLVQELERLLFEDLVEDQAPISEELAKVTSHQLESLAKHSQKPVDHLLKVIDQLLVLRTVLMQHKANSESEVIRQKFSQFAKICQETEKMTDKLSLIPMKEAFQKIQKIITESVQALGKKVTFEFSGHETQIDQVTLEQVWSLLVQWVGWVAFQSSEETIFLSASTRDDKIVFEVRDSRKVTGNIRSDSWVSEMKRLALGRHCEFEVISTGLATHLRLLVPSRLTSIHGVIVAVCGEKFIVPAVCVRESLQLSSENIKSESGTEGGVSDETIAFNGTMIPLFRLAGLFGRRTFHRTPAQAVALVIQSAAGNSFAVLVDEVLGPKEVIVKKMTGNDFEMVGIAGKVSLDPETIALVIDFNELINKYSTKNIINNLVVAA